MRYMFVAVLFLSGCATTEMDFIEQAKQRACMEYIAECEAQNAQLWMAGIPLRRDCTCRVRR